MTQSLLNFCKNKWVVFGQMTCIYVGSTLLIQALVREEQAKKSLDPQTIPKHLHQDSSLSSTSTISINHPNIMKSSLTHRETASESTSVVDASLTAPPSSNDLHNDHQHTPASSTADKSLFDHLAHSYDSQVAYGEFLFRVSHYRKKLLKNAKGRVLEVAAGTARNLNYFPHAQCTHLTLLDFSEKMLLKAMQKVETNPKFFIRFDEREKVMDAGAIPVEFVCQDARNLDFPDNTFDTVVETLSVCSFVPTSPSSHHHSPSDALMNARTEDPVAALNEMARVCKPDGCILLLDHGRSSSSWFNYFLDIYAAKRFEHMGCWWNQDIASIIRQSHIEVVEIRQCGLWNEMTLVVGRPIK